MNEATNMELWNKVCKTDPKLTKEFKGKGGFRGTAVCAQAQRKRATELFGPFGIGWGIRNEKFEIIRLGEDCHSDRLFYAAELCYTTEAGEGEILISAEIDIWMYVKNGEYWLCINDLRKKVKTDAMTKGLSELGFNSDIFEGKFDDNKYVQDMKNEFGDDKPGKKSLPKKDPHKGSTFDKQRDIDYIEDVMQKNGTPMDTREKVREDFKHASSHKDFEVILNKLTEGK